MKKKNSLIQIRPARLSDVKAIAEVHIRSWNETYAGLIPDDFLKAISLSSKIVQWTTSVELALKHHANSQVLVAEKSGKIVGFSSFGKSRGKIPGYSAEVYAIYMLKKFHGQGVGKRLMEESIQWSRDQGLQNMGLWVLEGNPTLQFYERMGFQKLGLIEVVDFGGNKRKHLALGLSLHSGH